jgi:hypothetical protein
MVHIVNLDWGHMKTEITPVYRVFTLQMLNDGIWGAMEDEVRSLAHISGPSIMDTRTLRAISWILRDVNVSSRNRNSKVLRDCRKILNKVDEQTTEAEDAVEDAEDEDAIIDGDHDHMDIAEHSNNIDHQSATDTDDRSADIGYPSTDMDDRSIDIGYPSTDKDDRSIDHGYPSTDYDDSSNASPRGPDSDISPDQSDTEGGQDSQTSDYNEDEHGEK